MEKSQDLALTQMRESIEKLGCSTEKYGNPTLARFLIAKSMGPDKAAKLFVQWRQWRSSMVPNGFIADSEVRDELEMKKIYLQGVSKEGCPLIIVKASKHSPSKDQLQFKKFVIYVLDKTIASSVSGREVGNEKMIVILDLQQLAYKNVDARGMITGFQFLQAYYPERLARLYLMNMPSFFVTIWRFISRFLDNATLNKIVMVSDEDAKSEMRDKIGEEVVPEEYGGHAKLRAIQDVSLPQPPPQLEC